MKPGFLHRGAGGGSAPESGGPPPELSFPSVPGPVPGRACCCPAWPVVRVIMPPAPRRPHPVDLLLCGHHYRLSRKALAAAGATVYDLPGRADAVAAALLNEADRSRVDAL